MSFEALKKQSKLGSLTDKLVKEVEKLNSNDNADDSRYWKPVLGKEGVGSAVIRFLPAPEGEELPWVKLYKHAFKGPTSYWYIENCLSSIAQKDPVNDYNRSLVAKYGGEMDKCPLSVQNKVREQKRKLSYYSNIYVIKDPANPENDGSIKLFKYGKKIFDKILAAMQPEFDDEEPMNPFDFWQGANFKLKITKKDGYWNYDKSEFDKVKPLLDDDDALEAIWKKEHSLSAIVAEDQFKSYEELEKRMNYVLGLNSTAEPTRSRAVMEQEEELESFTQTSNYEDEVSNLEKSYSNSRTSTVEDEDVDDSLKYFQALVDED
jgi:hypothetical protein